MALKHGMTIHQRVARVAAHATTRANMARSAGNMKTGAMQHSRARRAGQHMASHGAGHHVTATRVKAHTSRGAHGKVESVHSFMRHYKH